MTPEKEEFKQLQEKKKEEIDKLAHKQARRILWSALGFFMCQVGVFFRLTFWEFSWDVMEPIAFLATISGLSGLYAYFLTTCRDPTYQDFMERLFLSRGRKLCANHSFNMERYPELQKHLTWRGTWSCRNIASVLWKVIILMVLSFMLCNTRTENSLLLLDADSVLSRL